MLFFNQSHETEAISLEEFTDVADSKNLKEMEHLQLLGYELSLLGNNRTFLSEFLCNLIKNGTYLEGSSNVVPNSVVLARRDKYYVRANFWLPDLSISSREKKTFAYNLLHDHNFDFLTYAYAGSGYLTDLYEYQYSSIRGVIGEKIPLLYTGRHHHQNGQVMLYRCNLDVHDQIAPETLSITLNVLPTHLQSSVRDQYIFSVVTPETPGMTVLGEITEYATGIIDRRCRFIELASYVASDNIVDLLSEMAVTYKCERTRYSCLTALHKINRGAFVRVLEQVRNDQSIWIKQAVKILAQ